MGRSPRDLRVVGKVPRRSRCWRARQHASVGLGRLSSSASTRRRYDTRRQSTEAKLTHEMMCRLLARERTSHDLLHSEGKLETALVILACELAVQHVLQHDVVCNDAALVPNKLLYQTSDFVNGLW